MSTIIKQAWSTFVIVRKLMPINAMQPMMEYMNVNKNGKTQKDQTKLQTLKLKKKKRKQHFMKNITLEKIKLIQFGFSSTIYI